MGTFIVLAIVILLLFLAIRHIRHGGASCHESCGGCGGNCGCGKTDIHKEYQKDHCKTSS